jgi:hypothetical protein
MNKSRPFKARAGDRMNPVVREALDYANKTPELLSLLYDMDLMPEQVEEKTQDWTRMLILIERWRWKSGLTNTPPESIRTPQSTEPLSEKGEMTLPIGMGFSLSPISMEWRNPDAKIPNWINQDDDPQQS